MSEVSDLLQGKVECGDGVHDHPLNDDQTQTSTCISESLLCIMHKDWHDFLWCTSGGVFVGGVVKEALDEALDGEGLTDTFESLSSFAPLPFT